VSDTLLLDRLPLWALFLVSFVLVMVPAEIGFQLGRRAWRNPKHEEAQTVQTLVAPALGLLAFMLAFTFSLAQQRFENRRVTQLETANALGTAYMRAAFAAEPMQRDIRRLLRTEVGLYLEVHDRPSLYRVARRLEAMHDTLWRGAAAAAALNPESVIAGLLIQSVNEVIDNSERHINARLYGRIPLLIWVSLAALTMIGTGLMGYNNGLTGSRRSPAMGPVALGFCIVFFLIADLDRPHMGFLKTNRAMLLDLQSTLHRQ
jgi:hypothetical protein